MPKYKATQPGFFNDRLYGPNLKRKFVTTDKPFAKGAKPKWLTLVPAVRQTKAQKDDADQIAKDAAEKAAQDKIERDAVTFTENPKTVQTL